MFWCTSGLASMKPFAIVPSDIVVAYFFISLYSVFFRDVFLNQGQPCLDLYETNKNESTSYTYVWYVCTSLYMHISYKVPLREEARGVAQERNEKHPAWNEYHYAGNRRIKIVFGYLVRTNTLINKRTLHFRTGRYLFFAYTWRQTLWSYVILGILCNIIS